MTDAKLKERMERETRTTAWKAAPQTTLPVRRQRIFEASTIGGSPASFNARYP